MGADRCRMGGAGGAGYQVAVDPGGTVWILVPGALLKLDASRNRFVVIRRNVQGTSLVRDSDGVRWTRVTKNADVPSGEPAERALQPMLTAEAGLLSDRTGALWLE